MENMSDLYHYDVWIYDMLNPEEKLFVGRKPPRHIPSWAMKFPDELIGLAPEEIDQQERDRRNDEFLKQHNL